MTTIEAGGALAGISFALAWALAPTLARKADAWSLVDHPGGRKRHARPLPCTGGIAVFWATVLPLAALSVTARLVPAWLGGAQGSLSTAIRDPGLATALIGAAWLHGVGVVDDRRKLGAGVKLAAQVLAVLPLVAFRHTALLPEWIPSWLATAATILWFLVVINAFNFLDGLDGLLTGIGLISAAGFALVAALHAQGLPFLMLAALAGALGGFLRFNLPPARIFAGDGGALFVGYALAFASVEITYYDPGAAADTRPYALLTPLVILAVPLYDFASVLWLRIREGRSLVEGDTSHLSHRLMRRGLGPGQALVFICVWALTVAVAGILLMYVRPVPALLVALQALTLLALLALLEWRARPRA